MAKRRRTTPQRSARRGGRRSSRVEFNPDYSYVKSDLRRIATLAGTFIVLMVALALVLH